MPLLPVEEVAGALYTKCATAAALGHGRRRRGRRVGPRLEVGRYIEHPQPFQHGLGVDLAAGVGGGGQRRHDADLHPRAQQARQTGIGLDADRDAALIGRQGDGRAEVARGDRLAGETHDRQRLARQLGRVGHGVRGRLGSLKHRRGEIGRDQRRARAEVTRRDYHGAFGGFLGPEHGHQQGGGDQAEHEGQGPASALHKLPPT